MSAINIFAHRVLFVSLLAAALSTIHARPVPAGEPPLAGKLPQDCALYLGWGGWQATEGARAKTGLGELMHQPGMNKLLGEAEKWLNSAGLDMMMEKQNVPAPLRPAIKTVTQTAWQRPWAVSLTKVDPAMTSGTPVEGVLVIDLGSQADEFAKSFAVLMGACPMPMEDVDFQYLKGKEPAVAKIKHIKKDEGGGPEALAGVAGQHFVFALGSSAVKSLKGVFLGQDKTLADNPAFTSAAAKCCPGTSLLHVYADAAQLMPLAMMAAASDAKIGTALNVLGLDALKSVSLGVSYTGRNLTTAFYFAGPPAGLSVLVDPEPVKAELLKFVPADSCMFVALNADRAAIVNKVKALLDKAKPGSGAMMDACFEQVKQEMEIDIPAEVFPLLGKGVVLFNAPASGSFVFGWQLAIECKSEADAAKLSEILKKLAGKLNAKLQENKPATKLEVSEAVLLGQKLCVASIASKEMPLPLAVSWGQAGKVLVLGVFPQPVAETLVRVNRPETPEKNTILANPQYAALRQGVKETGSLVYYADTTGMTKLFYPMYLSFGTMGIAYLRAEGLDVSVADLPTQSQVLSALGPGMGGLATDQEGTLFTMTSPVGVAVPILAGGESGAMAIVVAVTAITALGHKVERQFQEVQPLDNEGNAGIPRPRADLPAVQPGKTLTLAHVETIRDAMTAYATGHASWFPANAKILLAADRAGDPPRLSGPAWGGPDFAGSFVCLSNLKSTDPGHLVLGYAKQKNNEGKRLVLYLNGQIRLCTVEQLKTALERTQAYLTEQGR